MNTGDSPTNKKRRDRILVIFTLAFQSVIIFLTVGDLLDLPRPFSLYYFWGCQIMSLVSYLAYYRNITVLIVILIVLFLGYKNRYAPIIFLAGSSFLFLLCHQALRWGPILFVFLYFELIRQIGRCDSVKFIKDFIWSFVVGMFFLDLYRLSPSFFYLSFICVFYCTTNIDYSYIFYFVWSLIYIIFVHVMILLISPYLFVVIFIYFYCVLCWYDSRSSLRHLDLLFRELLFILLDILFTSILIINHYYDWTDFLNGVNASDLSEGLRYFFGQGSLHGFYIDLSLYLTIFYLLDINSRNIQSGFSGQFPFCLLFSFIIGPNALLLLLFFCISRIIIKHYENKINKFKESINKGKISFFRGLLDLELWGDFTKLTLFYFIIIYINEEVIKINPWNTNKFNFGFFTFKGRLLASTIRFFYKIIKRFCHCRWPSYIYNCVFSKTTLRILVIISLIINIMVLSVLFL